MYTLSELKSGRAIIVDGDPYVILKSQFSKQGRQGGVMATKLRNMKTGVVVQKTFQGSDKVEPADVGYRKIQFLYEADGNCAFMDLKDYNQFELSDEIVGDAKDYLVEGQELDALIFDEQPIAIQLPSTVSLKVVETTPGVKGDTATGGTKPATLESGLTVNVPLFVTEEDTIKVNTETGTYMERVS